MIRINLLPEEPPKNVFKLDFLLLLLVTAIAVAVLGLFYLGNEQEISRQRQAISDAKKQIASLDKFYQEYMTIEKEKKEIQRRIQAIEGLKRGRALTARTLYDLTTLTKDTVWLRNFRKNEGNFELEGRALDAEAVSQLMESLLKVPYIKNVELKILENTSDEGLEVKKFVIQGNIGI
jgi:Tfp pilus assembly protein PilN